VNLVVMTLSQLSSSSPRRCPPWARAGSLATAEQADAVQRIEDLCRQYADPDAPVSDRAFRADLLVERAVRLGGARIGSTEPSSSSPSTELREGRAIFAKQPANCKAWEHFAAAVRHWRVICYLSRSSLVHSWPWAGQTSRLEPRKS
jgi:hypothetical protein